jgi:15-cis-phytoene synthase
MPSQSSTHLMQTHGKTFYWASFFLNEAMSARLNAIYGFCRLVDDAVDLNDSKLLASIQLEEIQLAWNNKTSHPTLIPLNAIGKQYWPKNYLVQEFFKGQLSDIHQRQPQSLDALLIYCYRVAGVVGLMACDAFEIEDPRMRYSAIDLGIAMQLVNICRDIQEDAVNMRIYLPVSLAGELTAAQLTKPTRATEGAIESARKALLTIADQYYESAEQAIEYLPKGAAFSVRVAAKLYQAIGRKMLTLNRPYHHGRTYLTVLEKFSMTLNIAAKNIFYQSKPLMPHNMPLHQALANLPEVHQ